MIIMINTESNQYNPDYAIHPGEILEETLEARGIKKTTFAEKCGISNKTVSQIIHGKSAITPEMAIKFERALGNSASLWINLNTDYELNLAREVDQLNLISQQDWVKKFPIKQLIEYGIIPKRHKVVDNLSSLLSFFGVGSVTAWNRYYLSPNVSYRKSETFDSNPHAVATWLRIGEILAEQIYCTPYSKESFKNSLQEIRSFSEYPPNNLQKKMVSLCKKSGVALVFVPELPKTHISGVAKWLTSEKAMIILSLRHKMEDHFWFSFFHEAAHILLHGKTEIFIDDTHNTKSKKEVEADSFASNILIPPKMLSMYLAENKVSQATVCKFAKKINLSPGVVVGRLQHDRVIPYSWLNKLKRKIDFSDKAQGIAQQAN